MISVYTDGAYSSKRNQGGWAFIVIDNDVVIYKTFLGVKNTTNNRMELFAIYNAIDYLNEINENGIIYSDSMYAIGCLKLGWKINKNEDIFQMFDKFDMSKYNIQHVKGHSENKFNNLCDTLAVLCTKV